MENTAEKIGSPDEKLLTNARLRYRNCVDAEQENNKRALSALKFRNLEQWDIADVSERGADPGGARPCMVMDKLNQHVRQVVNESRQNRPQIKIAPIGNGADIESARIYDGLIRNMQDMSNADHAYDTALEQAVDGGFGYMRLVTDYVDEKSFEQDIFIKRLRNRFSVHLDPNRQEADGSDAKFGFIVDKYTLEEAKNEFGIEITAGWSEEGHADGWYGDEFVMIAEYFHIEPEKSVIVLLNDGTSILKSEFDENMPKNSDGTQKTVIKERETTINAVKWCKLSFDKVLDKKDWAGKYIPIVEVVGNELDIEGKVYKSGLIFGAMDAQRVYNYATSAFVENVALAPRAPWIAATGQVENNRDVWQTANRRNISVLEYSTLDVNGQLVPPPTRLPPPGIPAGWQAVLQNAEHDIQSATGQYQASLGMQGNEKSGKAILARQHEGDMGTFHYSDNFARALRFLGKQYLELAPKILDTKRFARIINEDGTPEQVFIDPDAQVAYQKTPQGIIFNPNLGRYGVTIAVGPAFTTRRKEAAEWQIQMIQAQPELMQIIGDIVFRNNDAPGADEIAKRLKKTIPPALLEEDVEGVPPQVSQAMNEKDGQLAQAVETMKAMEAKIKSLESGEMSKVADVRSREKAEIVKIDGEAEKVKEQARIEKEKIEFERWKTLIVEKNKVRLARLNNVQQMPHMDDEGVEMEELLDPVDESAPNPLIAAIVAPRQISLQVDSNGMVTGGVSQVI